METMELSMSQRTEIKSIEVLEPNVRAHRFYQRLGYQDRIIDTIEKLKT